MPRVDLVFYQEDDGSVPVVEWLDSLSAQARLKCVARLALLEEQGHALRRPLADYLRDEIYELRIRVGRVNYRVLYFFHGRELVVISHGLVKEKKVPPKEIKRAAQRKKTFKANPEKHTFIPPLERGR